MTMTNSTLLSIFGIDSREMFFSNTVLLYHKNDREPFAAIQLNDGYAKLRTGTDLPNSGQRMVVD